MTITVLETKFELSNPKETMLSMEPTQDMHAIEELEARLDKIQMPYALVECRQLGRTTIDKKKQKDTFLGWSIITQLPLW